ncbi:hypothetical protein EOS_33015 [Caballeronia mineralivorans PML1(12)]|uniref:Uncharacterized protein n=1 Tax=Caballeronia mineralivorans PML1(12) TaxID=908627 RepID=A0A0J1CMF5_9BURK|nr:hypothetical protein [Caballeronia mineralivorans]KLU21965.1 hypothetical protein EOS_33015 [Caballeronia mineralivorans PML1(12)]
MINTIDHTGKRWNMLTAIRYLNHGKNGARWVFYCHQCGQEKIMPVRFVRNGKRVSCGCKLRVAIIRPSGPAVVWPFPKILGLDGLPVSPVWRQHEAPKPLSLNKLAIARI